jgi:uncharacterized membrane protein YidH (DUF202 family)
MGIVLIIAGILLILLSAAGFAAAYRILRQKKQEIRDEIAKI